MIAFERNKWRSGKFFVTGGPVLASCKTPLTRKALPCLYFQKTRSEAHIVSNLFMYTGPTAKRRIRPCCSLHFEQSFYQQLLNSRDLLQWRCLNKDLVVVLSSFHTNWNKLKGSKDFNWNDIGFASLCFLWFLQARMISANDFLQTCNTALMLSGHVSRIIPMQECNSKYREMTFNWAFTITQSRKIIITNPCYPRAASKASRCLVYCLSRCWYR